MATKHKKKKISKSDIIGEQGIALIHQRVSAMGFLWHLTGVEAGIDGMGVTPRNGQNRTLRVDERGWP